MADMHSFNVDVAKEVGVNAAILLQSIKWWCQKNAANDRHFHEGLYWTYNSTKALTELYPYLGKGAIGSALKKLEERGLIRTGNFNKSAYDRTKWYAITEDGLLLFGESIFRNEEMEEPKQGNRSGESGKPIPVTDHMDTISNNTGSMQQTLIEVRPKRAKFVPPTVEEVSAYIAEKGYHFDARQFVDYYEADDWRKSDGSKVRNWKRCCQTWEKHQRRDDSENVSGGDFSEFMRVDKVVNTWGDQSGQVPILRS